jgi:hypothetical protein
MANIKTNISRYKGLRYIGGIALLLLGSPAVVGAENIPSTVSSGSQSVAKASETILSHSNEAGLQLAIERFDLKGKGCFQGEAKSHFQLGESVCYRIHIPRTGKLVLFDINASGNATLLYPNNAIPTNAPPPCRPLPDVVASDIDIVIPDNCMGFEIKAEEPLGQGRVVAVLIEDLSVDVRALLATHRGLGRIPKAQEVSQPFEDIPKPKDWMEILRERLDQVFHDSDGKEREIRWSITALSYEISR